MKKIVMANWVSIDGYFAGPNGEIDWVVRDPEVDQAWHEVGNTPTDTLLSGRVSYQMFENVWPGVARDPNAPGQMKQLAREMNQLHKIVFSRTLKEVTWENTTLLHGNLIEEVRKLKQGDGPGMMIFGSGTIVAQLAGAGLIDEYLFTITPVVLGTGKRLFQDVQKLDLKLLETRDFKSGNVLLRYAAAS
jgi:dihydrofolate reductase